tara:strand:- start:9729 stop:9899 length:171 start_codon:yes stop_codon:yes gene_type:complete
VKQIVAKAISDNNWGLYLKSDPLTKVPIQEGTSMFKITDVDMEELLNAIENTELED